MHPRPRLAPSPATPICPEGAQHRTLDRVCPHSGRCSVTQLPPKVQHYAPSTAIARRNPPARQHNRHRGRTTPHPQHRLGLQTPSPATANRPEGTQECTLNQEHPALPLPQPHNHHRGRKEVHPRQQSSPTLGRSTEPHITTHSNRSRSVTPLTILRESLLADSVVPAEMRRC